MTLRTFDSFLLAAATCVLVGCGGGGSGGGGSSSPGSTGNTSVGIETRTFTNTGFTEVEIRNSFAFVVQEGDHFAIEVTVDADDVHLVQANQEGTRLRIEFDPSYTGDIRTQVARGIITLPMLDQVAATGSAFVDVAGFEQSYLEVVQAGSTHIEVSNSRIDTLTAVLTGHSHLSSESAAPVPAVHAEVSGSSQATFVIADGGTLTGSASGSSNISYYGLHINNFDSTLNTATVTWLGAAQP